MEQSGELDSTFEHRPLERIFQNSYARVLDFLILNQRFDYSYSDICKLAHVTPRTLQRVLEVLLKEELIVMTRKSGKAHMYLLNRNSVRSKALESYFNETMNYFLTTLKAENKPVTEFLDRSSSETEQ
jgi:hypothetical protein